MKLRVILKFFWNATLPVFILNSARLHAPQFSVLKSTGFGFRSTIKCVVYIKFTEMYSFFLKVSLLNDLATFRAGNLALFAPIHDCGQ